MLLQTKFLPVYPGGSVVIGGTKTFTFKAQGTLTGQQAIQRFLPTGSTPAVIANSKTDPLTSDGSVFAGQVVALRLNVDFSAKGLIPSGLGGLKLVSGPLAGYTVAQVLDLANTVLGGKTAALPNGLTISGLSNIVDQINNNFNDGTVNKGYLLVPPCGATPAPTPTPTPTATPTPTPTPTPACQPVASSLASNFDATSISSSNYLWFSLNFSASGIPSTGATISFTGGMVKIVSGKGTFNYPISNGQVVFSPSATCATTAFNGTQWVTTVPVSGSDEILLSALGIKAPADVKNATVTLTGNFSASTSGISLNWKAGTAVYTTDMTQPKYTSLGVKPTHTNACFYSNSDHAGTPENIKNFVTAGARGGGGSNFTGSWTSTASVKVCP